MGQVAKIEAPSLLTTFAERFGIEPTKALATLKATAFKGEVTNEQMMALLVVANEHNLNPWTKEIHAFVDRRSGAVVPVVGIDGWSRIINSNPSFDGMEFRDSDEMIVAPKGEHKPCPAWIECSIYRKDRSRPVVIRERFDECYRPGQGPWSTHTSRFLRHKAMIQCARVAFGFTGMYDPDEAERIREAAASTAEVSASERPRSASAALDHFSGVARPESISGDEVIGSFEVIDE
jgi:phage recombination protein Bet